jgi:hypothetical protein
VNRLRAHLIAAGNVLEANKAHKKMEEWAVGTMGR